MPPLSPPLPLGPPELLKPSSAAVMQGKRSEKLVFLDSIRGIGALIVVVSHFLRAFYQPLSTKMATPEVGKVWMQLFGESPLRIFTNGGYVVQIFFLLSGFALSISFFRSLDRSVLSSAAIRRYFRLAPPVFAAIMIAWSLQAGFGFQHRAAADRMELSEESWLRRRAEKKISFTDAAKQGVFDVFFKFEASKSLNTNLWTMQKELYGSFFVFALLALCGMHARRYLVYAALVFILWQIDRTLLLFLFGVILCDIFFAMERSGRRFELPLWGAVPLLLTGLFFCGLKEEWLTAQTGLGLPFKKEWMKLGALLLLTSVLVCPLFQRMLGWRPLVELGKISFAVYLLHWPLLMSFGCGFYVKLRDASWTHGASVAATAALSLPMILASAWLFYRLTDTHAIRLARWMEGWITGAKAPGQRPVTR